MKWMIWPRQYGKTYRMKQWWLEDPRGRVILTANETLARHHRRDLEIALREANPAMDPAACAALAKNGIMSFRSWPNARRGLKPVQIAVDEAGYILAELFGTGGNEVKMIAGAGRNEEPDPEIAAQVEAFNQRLRDTTGEDPE